MSDLDGNSLVVITTKGEAGLFNQNRPLRINNGNISEIPADIATEVSALKFEQNPTLTGVPQSMYWQNDDLIMQHQNNTIHTIGQNLYIPKCKATESINIGALVMYNQSSKIVDDTIQIVNAVNNSSIPIVDYLGVATHVVDITTVDVKICKYGLISGLNTSEFSLGDNLYLDSIVAGKLTNIPPSAPYIKLIVATVLKVGTIDGVIWVLNGGFFQQV